MEEYATLTLAKPLIMLYSKDVNDNIFGKENNT